MFKRKRRAVSTKVDQTALEVAICDNLSPEGIAAMIALLQIADNYRNDTPVNKRAINQVNWFRQILLDMVGIEEFNRLIGQIGL